MHLFQAVDAIREKVVGMQFAEQVDLWAAILKQIRKEKCFDNRYADAIEAIIRSLVAGLNAGTVIAMWRETEIGMADQADDEELVSDCVRMDLEVELLDAVTKLAYEEAKGESGV